MKSQLKEPSSHSKPDVHGTLVYSRNDCLDIEGGSGVDVCISTTCCSSNTVRAALATKVEKTHTGTIWL